MRNLVVSILMIVICSAAAYGGNKSTAREMDQFANEVAAKLVYRPDVNISVRARDCRLHIEYVSINVAFDLPLHGTTVAETDTEDGVILSNANMRRTIKDRNPEAFERLILRFDRKNVKSMVKTFENAVKACAGGGTTVAAAY